MKNTDPKGKDKKPEKQESQDNIGYDNTKTWNTGDDRENPRVQTTEPGKDGYQAGDPNAEDQDASSGLRSESGKKSQPKESSTSTDNKQEKK